MNFQISGIPKLTQPPFFHALSDVQSSAIGAGTRIWQYVVILHNPLLADGHDLVFKAGKK